MTEKEKHCFLQIKDMTNKICELYEEIHDVTRDKDIIKKIYDLVIQAQDVGAEALLILGHIKTAEKEI